MKKKRPFLSLFLTLAMSFCLILALSAPACAYVAGDINADATTEVVVETHESQTEPEPVEVEEATDNTPLTPDGNGNLADDSTSTNKEFITVQTKNGNYFYLILDKDRDSDNAYMLSQIDEADLKDFIEEEEKPSEPETTTPEVEESEDTEAETPNPESSNSSLLSLLLLAAAAGGAVYYFKVYKPKQDAAKGEQEIENKEYDDDEIPENEDEGDLDDTRVMLGHSFVDDGLSENDIDE